ncbi:MAG: alpha/beta hydrolase [Cyclobacteriaceae bacterium]
MKAQHLAKYVLILIGFNPITTEAQSIEKDIVYARADTRELLLDIYTPENVDNPALVIWVHGGAWHSGTKDNPPSFFIDMGYAVASIDYRLSIEAAFPAQMHDIKAAIRFLRANAKRYGYDADKFIIAGSSAGGHLAALVGTTNGNSQLEGDLGDYRDVKSDVQLILDFYGPTNFKTILRQSTPHGINVRAPALALLLGKPVGKVPELADLASPVYHVDPKDPPLFIAHGDQDIQVPVNQSLELNALYKKHGLSVQMEIVPGAGHSAKEVFSTQLLKEVEEFLKKHLLSSMK